MLLSWDRSGSKIDMMVESVSFRTVICELGAVAASLCH